MGDYMVRATAANAQVRAFAVTTKELVETARQAHNTSPVVTAALGRLLTAGAMMGSMMKGEKDVLTLQIKAGGPLQGITVTADSKGNVKAGDLKYCSSDEYHSKHRNYPSFCQLRRYLCDVPSGRNGSGSECKR